MAVVQAWVRDWSLFQRLCRLLPAVRAVVPIDMGITTAAPTGDAEVYLPLVKFYFRYHSAQQLAAGADQNIDNGQEAQKA